MNSKNALQRENIDMSDAGILFDGILDEYKEEEFAKYLSEDGDLVHVPVFQKAIIKFLKHKEADLTIEEKAAVESRHLRHLNFSLIIAINCSLTFVFFQLFDN